MRHRWEGRAAVDVISQCLRCQVKRRLERRVNQRDPADKVTVQVYLVRGKWVEKRPACSGVRA